MHLTSDFTIEDIASKADVRLLHLEFYKIVLIKKSVNVWINIWIMHHVIIIRAFLDLNLVIFLMNHTFLHTVATYYRFLYNTWFRLDIIP